MNVRTDALFKNFVEGRNSSKQTRLAVGRGLELFLTYYKEAQNKEIDLTALVEMIQSESTKEIEKRGQLETDWVGFARWLEDAGELAPRSIKLYTSMVHSFLIFNYYQFPGRARLPQSVSAGPEKQVNRKFQFRPPDVKKLIDAVMSLRDRAIILVIFQSGMDISTTLSLDIGHVKDELDNRESPLLIHVERQKTHNTYRTCIGADSIKAIQLYLKERQVPRYHCKKCGRTWAKKRLHCDLINCKGKVEKYSEKLTYSSPLFKQTNNDRRLRTRQFMSIMRQGVIRSSVIPRDRLDRASTNPAGTHALRAAMSSIMQFHGMNQQIIEGFIGHKVPYNSAYSRLGDEELRETYKGVEKYLTLDFRENIDKVEGRVKNLEVMNKGYEVKIDELKQEVQELKEKQDVMKGLVKIFKDNPEFKKILEQD